MKLDNLVKNRHETFSYAILSKKEYSKFFPIMEETVNNPEYVAGLPVKLALSLLSEPVLTAEGYPIARVKGGINDLGLTAQEVLAGGGFAPIQDGADEMNRLTMSWLVAVAKAMDAAVLPVDNSPFEFSYMMDTYLKERIANTRYGARNVSAERTAETLAMRLATPEYRRNVCIPIKERVATTEYVNRMLVFCLQQDVAGVYGFVDLANIIEVWMNKHKQHLSIDEMMGATSRWQCGKPNEPELPTIARTDCFPIAYEARKALFEMLALTFESVSNIMFPPKLARDTIPGRALRLTQQRKGYRQNKPASLKPYRPRGRGLIALPDGTKLVTVHNSEWYAALMEELMPVIENFFENTIA